MTGLWTEVCITWPTIEMLGAGYNIYVVEDCCGATSPAAQEAALSRMVQAGAVRLTTIAALLEWQRDWEKRSTTTRSWDLSNNRAALTAVGTCLVAAGARIDFSLVDPLGQSLDADASRSSRCMQVISKSRTGGR